MKITQKINPKMFREYDLRGVFGVDINEDVSYTIGKSFGTYIQNMGEDTTIIGHDNRNSSPTINKALIQGIIDTGINVISLGLVTTPMYYFARKHYNLNTGIMITASHNPKDDNGFKMAFSSLGNAYGKYIEEFRDFTLKGDFKSGNGNITKVDIKEKYLDHICNGIKLGDRKIKVVYDCGNGTGSIIIKDVLDRLNVEYELLYCESDGNFPNHQPDPAETKNMQDLSKKVVELGYDLGVGIDGDADRVGIVLENGQIISADLFMLIIYRNIVNKMKKKEALFDVKCSRTLIDELNKLNIKPVMYRTGNSYTNMKMITGDFDFGGEYSGHVFFRDKFPGFDDGIYAGLRMIEILSYKNTKLSEELNGINKYYTTEEIKVKVADDIKFNVIDKIKEHAKNLDCEIIDIDGVRCEFDDSWALVRASNTGPNITMRFEAKTKERLEEIQNQFTDLLTKLIDEVK